MTMKFQGNCIPQFKQQDYDIIDYILFFIILLTFLVVYAILSYLILYALKLATDKLKKSFSVSASTMRIPNGPAR
ncbi:MAG: hypothetical protein EOO96_07670, partial [Pedobacter sp.]